MKAKYYFEDTDSETCHTKEHFIDLMHDKGLEEMKVLEADRLYRADEMFCKKYVEIGEKGNCGKQCKEYKPRNGKSGNCIHTGLLYEHGKEITLKYSNAKS